MSTTIPNKEMIQQDWIELDASGKTLGEIAVKAASLLRGKHKVIFTPHLDTGDFVIVTNASKIRLTGKKATDKIWYRHSGLPNGLKATPYGELLKKKPEKMVEIAVKRMLPKNRLGRKLFTKLKVYADSVHPHKAQKPRKLEV